MGIVFGVKWRWPTCSGKQVLLLAKHIIHLSSMIAVSQTRKLVASGDKSDHNPMTFKIRSVIHLDLALVEHLLC